MVTSERPSSPIPAIDSVTQVGSPANNSSVLGCPEETDDTQFDHEVVDDLLRLLLVERPGGEIPFEVDVEERRGAAERHRRPVLFFDSGDLAEVQPLHRFLRGAGRARDIEPVALGHRDQFLECPDLLGQLLAVADDLVGGRAGVESGLLLLFGWISRLTP